VKYFFDTSVLVPALLDDHVHHAASFAALEKAEKRNSCCGTHSLAEVYSTLTRMPGPQRTSAAEAMLLLDSLSTRFTFITLDSMEYWTVIADSSEAGIVGGRIYDALLARCALKASAEIIYTWNTAHFLQLGDRVARRVRTP
jgi:predicted nucleic acid-binding protein